MNTEFPARHLKTPSIYRALLRAPEFSSAINSILNLLEAVAKDDHLEAFAGGLGGDSRLSYCMWCELPARSKPRPT
ncbi:hypothetical protein KC19_8G038300 [Ceratodon purpureus]|uniref:Uncharacterized protein n=1 Tax=Ceratodon purpureus TaxID=3225 RepID=A0A8T0GY89_CERPU|nr:hypothetical protein KC19_8G038300 [Ceratodon purpureus]